MDRRLIPLLGLLAVLLAGCTPVTPEEPTGPSGSVSPGPTAGGVGTVGAGSSADTMEIPTAALVTGEDVGEGYALTVDEIGDDHGAIGMMLAYCGVYDYSQASNHTISRRQGSVHRGQEEYVLVAVTRYESGWAQRYLEDLAAALSGCGSIPVMGSPDDIAIVTIIDTDFAGDGSLLIQEDRPSGTQFHAAVRRGDVGAYLRIHTGGDGDHARAIVQATADRLCAAVETC